MALEKLRAPSVVVSRRRAEGVIARRRGALERLLRFS